MNARECRSDCARWLHKIEADIIEVAAHKHIYTELREIVLKNPRLHGRSAFWTYLVETYGHYVAAAVRRQVKIDRRAASMARVLKHLAETPNAIAREWFVARFANASLLRTSRCAGGGPPNKRLQPSAPVRS